jgi:hypothetical protein
MSVLSPASVSIKEKAERLLISGAVIIPAAIASVKGDHGTYAVVFREGRWKCNCPARKRCSHIEAVERVTG